MKIIKGNFANKRNWENCKEGESVYDLEEQKYDELTEKSKLATNNNLVGHIFKHQIADGYAEYLIIEDKGGEDITLQHIDLFDAYEAPVYVLRGLRREDILKQKAFTDYLNNLKQLIK